MMYAIRGFFYRLNKAWIAYWFFQPNLSVLALMRVCVGVILFFNMFTYSFDLSGHLGAEGWGLPKLIAAKEHLAWPFSLFSLVDSPYWLWTVHIVALMVVVVFILGIFPFFSGLASLVFFLSYLHRNPAVMVDLDALLLPLLLLLTLSPTGGHFSLSMPTYRFVYSWDRDPGNDSQWGSFMLRILQFQISLWYVGSALTHFTPEWMTGATLIHPRFVERGLPLGLLSLQTNPALLVVLAYGLVLFPLFYGVMVWFPGWRHPLVAVAMGFHMLVGFLWGNMAVNLCMMAANLAFAPPSLVLGFRDWIVDYLGLPWFPPQAKPVKSRS